MTPKKILWFIIFIIILLIIAVGLSKITNIEPEDNTSFDQNYGSKIVYTTDIEEDADFYQNDCRERGGDFNSCGNTCAPEAEACAEMCAFTCENIDSGIGDVEVPSDWKTYSRTVLNFQIMYPPDMEVASVERGGVNFSVWGPTQIEASEFFDGVSLTIREVSVTNNDIESFVRAQLSRDNMNALSGSLRQVVIDDKTSYEFVSMGELAIPTTYIYVPTSNSTALEITYVDQDPTGQGFQDIVDTMLSTLDIHPEVNN
jgi:hypothetical protein